MRLVLGLLDLIGLLPARSRPADRFPPGVPPRRVSWAQGTDGAIRHATVWSDPVDGHMVCSDPFLTLAPPQVRLCGDCTPCRSRATR